MLRYYRINIAWLFAGSLLLSCQQLSLNSISDYSGLLPQQQLLYLSVQQMNRFHKLPAQFLADERLQNFVSKRLRRSQLAIGPQGQIYAINQLALDSQWFARHIAKQSDWQAIPQLPMAYLHSDGHQALQMPQSNLLYLSQGPVAEGQVQEQRQWAQLWQKGAKRNKLPQRFLDLQAEKPLVAYSPQIIHLIINPWLQRAFPRTLNSFSQVSKQFPVSQMLAWLEIIDKEIYALHLELATGSLPLSKGLEAGFRLFLPSLLMRSKQEFIRRQLPNVQLESTKEVFRLQMPLDQNSVSQILSQLKI